MKDAARLRAGIIGFGVGKLYAASLRSLHLYYPDLPDIELAAIATASEKSGGEGGRAGLIAWDCSAHGLEPSPGRLVYLGRKPLEKNLSFRGGSGGGSFASGPSAPPSGAPQGRMLRIGLIGSALRPAKGRFGRCPACFVPESRCWDPVRACFVPESRRFNPM